MAQLLRMPEVAAGGTTAVLASWSITENVAFSAEDTLAEIETDKANVDLDAESDGVLLKKLVTAGAEVAVGDPIALLGTEAEQGGDITAMLTELGVQGSASPPNTPPATDDEPTEDEPGGAEPVTASTAGGAGTGARATGVADTGARATGVADAAARTDGVAEPAEPEGPAEPDGSGGQSASNGAVGAAPARIFASPLARQLARDAGLTLGDLTPGSGPGGRVRRSDVQAAIRSQEAVSDAAPVAPATPEPTPEAPAAPPAAAPASAAGYLDTPHTRLRRLIATRLTESKQTVPHFYLNGSARVDKLLALRSELNEDSTVKISVNDLIIKAVAKAHSLIPEMNVIWTPDALRQFEHVDISVAIASDRGLVTPTLRAVDTMAVGAIAERVKDFVQRAGAGKLKQNELEGGALSVTNLGMFGTEDFGAIINPPQSAILAVGAARQQPTVVDGRLEVGTMMRVTLSVDHRAIDGRLAAEWLRTLLSILEKPMRILT